jgi:hypothetical protein
MKVARMGVEADIREAGICYFETHMGWTENTENVSGGKLLKLPPFFLAYLDRYANYSLDITNCVPPARNSL